MNDEKLKYEELLVVLGSIFGKQKAIEEKIDCILHAVCKSNDGKTKKAIQDYLTSNYRNRI